jgi:hypothetical protein
MSEKFLTLEQAITKHKDHFSLEDIKVYLESSGDEERLLSLLEGVQEYAFDEKQQLTKEGKSSFSNFAIEVCLRSLNKFNSIEGQAALAKVKGQSAEEAKIEGSASGATPDNISDALVSFNGVIYGWLNQYGEEGLLTIDEMKQLGFTSKDIKVIEESLKANAEKEKEDWENGGAEKTIPKLSKLEPLIKSDVNSVEEAENQIQEILVLIADIEDDLKAAGISGDKYQFVEDRYLNKAKARETELNSIKTALEKKEGEVEAKEKKGQEVEVFEENIKDFTRAIEAIPFSRKEIVTIEVNGKEERHDPDDKSNSDRFEQQEMELKRRRSLLIEEKQKAESSGVLKKRDSTESASADEINRVIDEVLRKSSEAEKRVEQLIREAEKPPVEEMGLNAIVKELIDDNHDPYFYKEQKSGVVANQRAKELSEALKDYYNRDPESTPEEELNRVVQIVKLQLNFLSNQLQHEPGLPTRERTQLWKEAIQRQLKRREILIATTYHPEWGKEVRDMLEWSFRVAALRKDSKTEATQILVRRKRERGLRAEAGEEVLVGAYLNAPDGTELKNALGIRPKDKVLVRRWVNKEKDKEDFEDIMIEWEDRQDDDKPLEKWSPDMDYGTLTKELGEIKMKKQLEERFPNGNPQALKFAMDIFGCFDLLTISLGELQKNTKTRGHNGDVKDKDRIMFADPLASAMHKTFRYWNENEWSLRALLFIEDINNGDARYGIHDDKKQMKNHTWLSKLQNLLLMHQSVFYSTDSFAGKVPLPEFCEATGINTYDFLTLHSAEEFFAGAEVLELPDGRFVIHDGRIIGKEDRNGSGVWTDQDGNEIDLETEGHLIPKSENIAITKWYELAEENGFAQLLELTFKRMPVLSDDDIFRKQADGKAGVLNNWLATAGRAKMFPGSHMKNYLEPLLTNFVLRIFQQYKGRYNRDLREAMFKDMIAALEASALDPAGLGSYEVEVANIINALCETPIYDIKINKKTGKKKATKNGNNPVQGQSVKPWEDRRDKERDEYLAAWYRHKFNHEPPTHLMGINLDSVARPLKTLKQKYVTGKNPEELEFMEIIQGKHPLPDLVERAGDLMQKDETGKDE